jgi:hypothetical protein
MDGANIPSNAVILKLNSSACLDSQSLVSEDDCRVGRDFQSLTEEIQRVRARVRHSNLVQAALLRRAGRRARTISNFCEGKATTYNRPFLATEPFEENEPCPAYSALSR